MPRTCTTPLIRFPHPAFIGLLTLGLASALLAADWKPLVRTSFDTKESAAAWTFFAGKEFPGAAGRVAWEDKQGHDAPGALALHYDFAGGGNYVMASTALDAGNAYRAVRLCLHKPGPHRVTFRAIDSQQQSFQKGVELPGGDWLALEIDLTRWDMHFGGAKDGKIRWPLRMFGVIVENTASPRDGVMLVDDIEWSNDVPAARTQRSSYDILPQIAGAGSALDRGVWEYRDGATALHGDFSLLASPQKLIIDIADQRYTGGGEAPEVFALIGSHFQYFRRSLGRLTGKGSQTLEAPLNDLSSWSHDGGENDGQRRLPLRLLALQLEGLKAGATGRIEFKRVAVETDFTPREAVTLIPSVRQSGDSLDFAVQLRNLRPGTSKGRLVAAVRTLQESLAQQTFDIDLPGGGASVTRTIHQPIGDRALIDATFTWTDAEGGATPANVGWAAPIAQDAKPTIRPESAVGAGLYLYRWNRHPQARENMTRVADLATAAGVNWTREEIQWGATEPERGRFDWSFYDQMVGVATSRHIRIYGLLAYWSGWTKINTEEGVADYCRWAREVVKHYKHRIKHWEIWNEPNIFFWSGPKELYAKMLTQAYAAIKAEDPDAVVMGCSTAGIDRTFIENVMKWGGKFDALTIHPYRGVLDDLSYIKELEEVRKLVGGRSVWITEIGFPSQLLTGYSERNQASLVARTYIASLASGAIDSVSWYDFRNDGLDPFYNEYNFGLVRNDLTLKPGYRLLATVGRMLGGAKVLGPMEIESAPAGAYAFRFARDRRETVVVCSPLTGGVLSVDGGPGLSVIDAAGEAVKCEPTKSGSLVITLFAGMPIYVTNPESTDGAPAARCRLRIDCPRLTPSAVVPGGRVRVELKYPKVEEWELPAGWPVPVTVSDGVFDLQVPESAAPGKYPVTARFLGLHGGIPMVIVVRAPLTRI